jgi:outer membrane lipoprotein-sorting protein
VMPRLHSCFRITITLLLIALAPTVGWGQKGKVTIDDILEIWKERQQKVKSARFELTCEETIPKGRNSFVNVLYGRKAGMQPETEPNPPRDYLVKGTSAVILDGIKLHYSYDHEQWDPVEKKLYAEHYEDVYDGEFVRSVINPESAHHIRSKGNVDKASKSESGLRFPILPLILTLRGNHPQFFQDLVKFQITRQSVMVGGRPCLELVRDSGPPGQREFLFLDQKRDYVTVKEMIVLGGQPNWQVDATYTPDPQIGWVPKSWEYIIRAGKDHVPMNFGRTTVTAYEINVRVDDNEFNIDFKPKTMVQDNSSGQLMQYLIRADGEKGVEIPAGQIPTYEELDNPSPRMKPWMWVTIWTVIFVAALGGWNWLRHPRTNAVLGKSESSDAF